MHSLGMGHGEKDITMIAPVKDDRSPGQILRPHLVVSIGTETTRSEREK